MNRLTKRSACAMLALVMLITCGTNALAATDEEVDSVLSNTAACIYSTVKNPQIGSIGGEWAVLGLARSGYDVPDDYYEDYYETVEAYVTACDGVLHARKYTEYSRLIIALTSIGKDPTDVAGYNLLIPLGDYNKTIWQGLNGPIWALIALDSGNYDMPQNTNAKTQATRAMYVDFIISKQLSNGGFSLTGEETADPGITAMALQALAKYTYRNDVTAAVNDALACISAMQDANGGFSSYDTENSESGAQVIVALCELNISLDDARFIKNGNTLLDSLLSYYIKGSGFAHTVGESSSDQMATEQEFYALVAAQRLKSGKNSLYRMSDAIRIDNTDDNALKSGNGLEGKNVDVKSAVVVYPGRTFGDISGHVNQQAIEALAARGIINGCGDGSFHPDSAMTRAEFAATVVRGLALTPKSVDVFTDVSAGKWYASYIGTAYTYGIINGAGGSQFNPDGTITRQEAATMTARAAKLCGMDTHLDTGETCDILAQFGDYVTVKTWAQSSLAFCYSEDILSNSDLEIAPKAAILRCEIAEMLFRMLSSANLMFGETTP